MTTCSAAYNNVHQNPKQRSHRIIHLHLATTHTSSLFPQLTQNLKRQHPHVKNKINQKEEKYFFLFFFLSFGGGGGVGGGKQTIKEKRGNDVVRSCSLMERDGRYVPRAHEHFGGCSRKGEELH